MKYTILGAALAATVLWGCNRRSEEGGRAGNDTFRVVVPAMTSSVKQGELVTVRVSLDRDQGFKQRVRLAIKAPSGISVEPNDATVEPGDKGDLQLQITAASDAAVGQHQILVRGTPDKGEAAETEIRITVTAK